MAQPQRIQRKRSKGWKMPENTVYVGRPSAWGNPFNWRDGVEVGGGPGRGEGWAKGAAVQAFREWLQKSRERIASPDLAAKITADPRAVYINQWAERNLRGKNLACWCKEGEPCHADVLIAMANPPSPLSRCHKARTPA